MARLGQAGAAMTHGPRAYGYTRVSHEHQAESGLGLEAQERTIRAYYRARLKDKAKWAGLHADKAVSAARHKFAARPEGKKLLGLLMRGDHVIIAKLDRGFRSIGDAVGQLERWQAAGIGVHLLDLHVDLTTPTGRMVFHVLAAIAEWESRRIGERIREAFAAQRARGRAPNGAWTWGHRLVRGRLLPDTGQRRTMGRIVALRKRGLIWREIAATLTREKRPHPRRKRWSHQAAWRAYYAERALRGQPRRSKA